VSSRYTEERGAEELLQRDGIGSLLRGCLADRSRPPVGPGTEAPDEIVDTGSGLRPRPVASFERGPVGGTGRTVDRALRLSETVPPGVGQDDVMSVRRDIVVAPGYRHREEISSSRRDIVTARRYRRRAGISSS